MSRPARLFSSAGVPVAIDSAVVDDDDVVGQLVGLLQVLRRQQHVGARRGRAPGWRPTARCGCAGRARSSARRAAAAAARRRGWRRGRAGGACRPSSRARGGRRPRSGRSGRARRRRRPAPRGGRGRTGGRPSRGSPARSAPARRRPTGRPGRSPGAPARDAATASMPATRQLARVGSRCNVATARTNVVLPAPLGPSTAVTAPAGATRSRPSRATTSVRTSCAGRVASIADGWSVGLMTMSPHEVVTS